MEVSKLTGIIPQILLVILLIIISIFSNSCESKSRAHHKVHNLALYPERHSWCQATPIKQEIASHDPECSPSTIDNVVCLGACFSYSVPRAQDDAVIPPYCDACRPTKASWTVISLNCTKSLTGEHYYLPKNVEMISNCSCVDCNDNSPRGETNNEESSGDSTEELDNGLSHDFEYENVNPDNDDADEIQDGDEDEDDDNGEEISNHNLHHNHHHSQGAAAPGLPGSPTLHNLRSVSAELKGISKAEEELMIKDNKISPDDDDDVHDNNNNDHHVSRHHKRRGGEI